jgi:hypothetical protein
MQFKRSAPSVSDFREGEKIAGDKNRSIFLTEPPLIQVEHE